MWICLFILFLRTVCFAQKYRNTSWLAFRNAFFCVYGTDEAWLAVVLHVYPLSSCRPQFSFRLAVILHPPSDFLVYPQVLPMQVAYLLCVSTGWLLNMLNCTFGHRHLKWVCVKCSRVILRELLQLLLVYSRNPEECLWGGVHSEEAPQGWGGRNCASLQKG